MCVFGRFYALERPVSLKAVAGDGTCGIKVSLERVARLAVAVGENRAIS